MVEGYRIYRVYNVQPSKPCGDPANVTCRESMYVRVSGRVDGLGSLTLSIFSVRLMPVCIRVCSCRFRDSVLRSGTGEIPG